MTDDIARLNDHLTDEQRLENARRRVSLEAEIERRKNLAPRQEVVRQVRDDIFCVADVMPEMIASMERQREKWTIFCESIRPLFSDLPDTKACPHHPSSRRAKLFEETCQQSRIAGTFKAAWAPCGKCCTIEARGKQRAFWSRRGVPARVVEATFANFQADTEEKVMAVGKVRDWIRRNGTFLLLTGTPGTGKGHLAAGCLKAQGNGLFITHADMLGDLRASYTLHTTKEVLATWQESEMLVLDEFGLSPGGKDEEPMLYQVLAKRYEERRPTIITSNLPVDELRTAIGYRLLDRMQEDCSTVVCKWPSNRTGK